MFDFLYYWRRLVSQIRAIVDPPGEAKSCPVPSPAPLPLLAVHVDKWPTDAEMAAMHERYDGKYTWAIDFAIAPIFTEQLQ